MDRKRTQHLIGVTVNAGKPGDAPRSVPARLGSRQGLSVVDSGRAAMLDIEQAALDRARLGELNRHLERAVAERTAALNESVARLRWNEERLGLALEAGCMGTWVIDIANRQCTCDERHERLYGRKPGKPHPFEEWLAYLHPEDYDRMAAVMLRAMQGIDTTLSAEYRIVWPDGSVHWLMARGRVFFDERGQPVSISGVEQDMDERKALEMEVLHIADTEQRRIGQELHDDIQQRLTGLGLIAQDLCEQLAHKAAPEHGTASRLARGIGDISERVNRLSHGLVPLDLNGEGLGVALSRLARFTDTPGRLRCTFKCAEALEVHDGFAATHLYRIAQEAVTNAIRHSGASRITLSLSRVKGLTTLTVADNGCGIDDRSSAGRGLRIMAYRASLIGATFKVERSRLKGTRASCALALPAAKPALEPAGA